MKYKRIKLLGFMLTLALVIGLLTVMSLTAFADEELSESFTTDQAKSTYTGQHFKITTMSSGRFGFALDSTTTGYATITSLNGEVITKVEFTSGQNDISTLRSQTGTVSVNGDVATVSGVNATSLTVNSTAGVSDCPQIKAVTVYYVIPQSTYTITIPSTLEVQDSGWNELPGGITATGELVSKEKLVITATSANDFYFVYSGDNSQKVAYDFCASSTDLTPLTTWEFEALSSDVASTQPVGINVADFSDMPSGIYNETVTFTANVVRTITIGDITITYNSGDTWQDVIDRGSSGLSSTSNGFIRNNSRQGLYHDSVSNNNVVFATEKIDAYDNYLWAQLLL